MVRFLRGLFIFVVLLVVAGLLLGWQYGEKPKKPGQFDNQAKAAMASLGKDAGKLRFPAASASDTTSRLPTASA